jgi:hypothetical protein
MSIIHGLSLASTDVVRAVKLVEEHPIYAFVSMHVVIIYSAFKIIACAPRVYLELGLESQEKYIQLVPLGWFGASGMDWGPRECWGASGMDWRQLEWCGTQHMQSSSDFWAHDQCSDRALSTPAAFADEQHA